MKYHSNIIFRLFILFYILALVATIIVAYFLFVLSALGCSAGCASNYLDQVIGGLFLPVFGIILFLIFSVIVLFMQQYKNHHFGYLMLISTPFDIYIVYKIFSFFPILYFIRGSFKESEVGVGIIFIIIAFLIIIVALIPFYVLGRLIKEDLLKK